MKILLHAIFFLVCAGCTAIPAKQKECIAGSATMQDDRSIILMLRAEGPDGSVGDATFEYRPDDHEYDEVLSQLGSIEPGQDKFVPCWPDSN
jgi:hypothetical protein